MASYVLGPIPPRPGRQDKDVSSPRGAGNQAAKLSTSSPSQPPLSPLLLLCWRGGGGGVGRPRLEKHGGCTFRLHQAWPGVPLGSWKVVAVAMGGVGRGPPPAKAAGPASFYSFHAGGKEGAPYSCGSCYVLGEYRAGGSDGTSSLTNSKEVGVLPPCYRSPR